MSDFTDISAHYRRTATLQKSAAEQLFEMLALSRSDDVLDLGCGPGHLSHKMRALTDGRIVGIDPAPGMIAEAQRNYPGIEFRVGNAESLSAAAAFDAIFCNSAFQWFRDPAQAVANCYGALRPGGRMAMQAPARQDYCPNFIHAAASLLDDARTRDAYAHFHSPWFFLETGNGYAALFEQAGFDVVTSQVEQVIQYCSPEKAMEMFDSGAAAGYLNPDCYDAALPPDYIETARELIARDFQLQAQADGQLELSFFRVYLLARKPA